MKIAIDLRSLQSGSVSGVENYTLNLLEELLEMDRHNSYLLFTNSWQNVKSTSFDYISAKSVKTRLPNKVLNLLFKFNFTRLEDLLGDFDCLFMPNLNLINLNSSGKVAITVHDLSFAKMPELYDLKRNFWHKYLNVGKFLHRADIIFAVSSFTKNDLVKIYKLSEEKIKVIYPGLNPDIFNEQIKPEKLRLARSLYNLPGKFFLFLNTLEPRKNLIGTIEAFEQSSTDACLVIAGKLGWKTGEILKKIKNSKKKSKIRYVGYIPEDFKPALIKLATALLYPSFYEGFGFQALEAMAVGTPVIASQVASLPEITQDAALLVNPYNIRDLTHAMEAVVTNSNLSQILIHKGLIRAKAFSWQRTASQTLGYLQALCA